MFSFFPVSLPNPDIQPATNRAHSRVDVERQLSHSRSAPKPQRKHRNFPKDEEDGEEREPPEVKKRVTKKRRERMPRRRRNEIDVANEDEVREDGRGAASKPHMSDKSIQMTINASANRAQGIRLIVL